MSIKETRARIESRIWQALADGTLDLEGLPREKLEALVTKVTDAALLEIDDEISRSLNSEETQAATEDDESVLWEGRPLLSISTRYIITDERLRVVEGLLGKSRTDVELVRIQDLAQRQSAGERVMNVGDLVVHSHDRSHPQLVLNNVKDPQEVHEILRRAVLEARKKHGMSYREEM